MPRCGLIVELDLKPGAAAEAKAVLSEHAKLTLAEEPGCQQFDLLVPEQDGDRLMLVEVYVDRAAYEVHRQGARMPGVNEALGRLTTGRKVTVCAID